MVDHKTSSKDGHSKKKKKAALLHQSYNDSKDA